MGEECLLAFLPWKEEKACHNEFQGTVPFACSKSQCPAILGLLLVSWTFAGATRCQLMICHSLTVMFHWLVRKINILHKFTFIQKLNVFWYVLLKVLFDFHFSILILNSNLVCAKCNLESAFRTQSESLTCYISIVGWVWAETDLHWSH